MPILEVNGVKLSAQVLGEGAPLLTLHGLVIGNQSSWYLALASLANAARRIILYDQRGHGNSEMPPSGYDLNTLASDLSVLADKLGLLDPFDIAGHSYGGLVALRFALDAPNRVRRLILVDSPLPPLREVVQKYLKADMPSLLRVLPDQIRKAALRSPRRAAATAKRIRRLIDTTTLVEDVRSEPPFVDRELGNLMVPVLCIYGTDSEYLADGQRLRDALPGAQLETIPGSHQLLLENAARVKLIIEDFLNA